jgi:hypothetical protein
LLNVLLVLSNDMFQQNELSKTSGLIGTTYEERLKELSLINLEERRHRLEMTQTYKIVSGKERVQRGTWFQMASDSASSTRQAAGPLNLKPNASKLEIRRNFFSYRVVEDWNKIPIDIKMSSKVESFKKGYARFRE